MIESRINWQLRGEKENTNLVVDLRKAGVFGGLHHVHIDAEDVVQAGAGLFQNGGMILKHFLLPGRCRVNACALIVIVYKEVYLLSVLRLWSLRSCRRCPAGSGRSCTRAHSQSERALMVACQIVANPRQPEGREVVRISGD